MSRDASVTLEWGDGDYVFRLGQGELMELQQKTDSGPMWVLNRMMAPTPENRGWRIEDIREVIRLGLIGGGLEPVKALRLVRVYVEARPPMENLLFAQSILAAGIMGVPDELPQKKSAASRKSTTSPEASGDGPPSSAPVPQ
jgi:hypothetical protein